MRAWEPENPQLVREKYREEEGQEGRRSENGWIVVGSSN
jgi:hypothetical protein